MKHIVVLGAGLGGMPMAFELQALLKPENAYGDREGR